MRVTGCSRSRRLSACSKRWRCGGGVMSIGAFTGWGGVIYALAHLGVLLESSDYIDRAETLVPLVEAAGRS